MKKFTLILVSFVLYFISSSVFSYQIEEGQCYSVDGPANIRDRISGKAIDKLDHGAVIKILKAKDNWYQITYSGEGNDCPVDNGDQKGWTHSNNVLALGSSLTNLINSGKVQLGVSSILYSESEFEVEVLGEKFAIDFTGEVFVAKVPKHFYVTLYCLNGRTQKNQILSLSLKDAGGTDGFQWHPTMKLKYDRPKGSCIMVNGAIKSNATKPALDELGSGIACDLCKNAEASYKCSFKIGDFNRDGILDGLVHKTGVVRGIYEDITSLWRVDKKCNAQHIGIVSAYVGG